MRAKLTSTWNGGRCKNRLLSFLIKNPVKQKIPTLEEDIAKDIITNRFLVKQIEKQRERERERDRDRVRDIVRRKRREKERSRKITLIFLQIK